jgi:hypothetical protein
MRYVFDLLIRVLTRFRLFNSLLNTIFGEVYIKDPALPVIETYHQIQESFYREKKEGHRYLYAFVESSNYSLSSILVRFLTKIVNKGKSDLYTHAGVLLIHDGYFYVMDMLGTGRKVRPLIDLLEESDRVAILRYELKKDMLPEVNRRCSIVFNNDVASVNELIAQAYSFIPSRRQTWLDKVSSWLDKRIYKPATELEYDYSQELGNSGRIYCSELVYLMGYNLVIQENFIPVKTETRYVFTPQMCYDLAEVIFERRD